MVTKTYKPSNLCGISDSCDSSDSCDNSDSSDRSNSSDSNDQNNSQKLFFFTLFSFIFFQKKTSLKILTEIVMKHKNLNCDETQIVRKVSCDKTQIVTTLIVRKNLKNKKFDETSIVTKLYN